MDKWINSNMVITVNAVSSQTCYLLLVKYV